MVIALRTDALHQRLEQFLARLRGSKAKGQRQDARGLRAVVVKAGLGIEVLLLEGRRHLGCERLVLVGVGALLHDAGILRHTLQNLGEIRRRQQRALRDACRILRVNQFRRLGRYAPVGVRVFREQPILDVTAHVLHPQLHGRVVALNDARVAVLLEHHPWSQDEGARPGSVVVVDRPVVRRDVGDSSVRLLRIGDVADPFCVKRRQR